MAASFSYWKGFIDKTLKDRKRRLPLDDMDNMVKRKDIIRTLIDDHRDVAMYRHALCAIHLKLIGMSSGATPHYEDGTGFVRLIFKKINRLRKRIEELETTVKEYEEKGVCIR